MADAELISALRDSAQGVVADHCTSQRLHAFIDRNDAPFDCELWKIAAELGWFSIATPERYGGMGAGLTEMAALQMELGRGTAPIPFLSTVLVTRALALWPHEQVAGKYLPGLASGESVGAVAQLGKGEHALRAEIIGGAVRVSGQCSFVLDGAGADLFLAPIRSASGDVGGTLLLPRAFGVTTERRPAADRTRTVVLLRCEGLDVPADHALFGSEALEVAETVSSEACVLLAHDAIGGVEMIFDKTVDYLKTRMQFGKAIGSFQALKHRCADHKVNIEATKFLTQKAAQCAPDARASWAAMAKFHACDTYAAVAADCVQLHGGIGFTWEHDAHLFLKRALLNQAVFGDSASQLDQAAGLLTAQALEL
jgi:alkylation response protein AidB-like acyl-CoA dehydrogenase